MEITKSKPSHSYKKRAPAPLLPPTAAFASGQRSAGGAVAARSTGAHAIISASTSGTSSAGVHNVTGLNNNISSGNVISANKTSRSADAKQHKPSSHSHDSHALAERQIDTACNNGRSSASNKFNRILSNLESAIKNQFSSNQNNHKAKTCKSQAGTHAPSDHSNAIKSNTHCHINQKPTIDNESSSSTTSARINPNDLILVQHNKEAESFTHKKSLPYSSSHSTRSAQISHNGRPEAAVRKAKESIDRTSQAARTGEHRLTTKERLAINRPCDIESRQISEPTQGSATSGSCGLLSTVDNCDTSLSNKSAKNATSTMSSGKSTLNKYQQQLMSLMRTSVQQQHNTVSSHSNLVVPDKALIPPPHASDEARNQKHCLMFGTGSPAYTDNQHKDHASPASSASSGLATKVTDVNVRVKLPSNETSAEHKHPSNNSFASSEQTNARLNASPASSAKSLPNLAARVPFNSSTSNTTNMSITERDDEESGFSSYQSRRSLVGTHCSGSIANVSSINSYASTTNLKPDTNASNYTNMNIINSISNQQHYNHAQRVMQQSEQFQYLRLPNNMVQQPQSALRPQSHYMQLINGQMIMVPYTNATQQHLGSPQHLHQYRPISNVNAMQQPVRHQLMSYSQPQQQPVYVFYTVDKQTPPIAPAKLNNAQQQLDNNQQIYANAPPKPRRYQYYDSNGFCNLLISPDQSNQASNLPTTAPIPMMPVTNSCSSAQHMLQRPIVRNQSIPLSTQQIYQYNAPFNYMQPTFNQMQQVNRQVSNDPYQTLSQHLINQPASAHGYRQVYASHNGLNVAVQSKSNVADSQDTSQMPTQHTQHNHNAIPNVGYSNNFDNSQHYVNNPRQVLYMPVTQNNAHPPFISNQQTLGRLNTTNTLALQRSKSIAHLTSEEDNVAGRFISQTLGRSATKSTNHALLNTRFNIASSASTHNLNYSGCSNSQQYQPNQEIIYRVGNMNEQAQSYEDALRESQSMQNAQMLAPAIRAHATAMRQRQALDKQQQISQFQMIGNQTRLAPNDDKANAMQAAAKSLRQIRQPNGSSSDDCATKPSLDDKIKHLIISDDECVPVIDRTHNAVSFQDGKSDSPNRYHQSTVERSDEGDSRRTWTAHETRLMSNSVAKAPNFAQADADQSAHGMGSNKSKITLDDASLNEHKADIIVNPADTRKEEQTMGNKLVKQQQQYHIDVQKHINDDHIMQVAASESYHSQLIVDLTTPRVLAKTQTNLKTPSKDSSTADSHGGDAWSMNQVGLPAVQGQQQNTVHIKPLSDVKNAGERASVTNLNLLSVKPSEEVRLLKTRSSSIAGININSVKHHDAFERSAPYYYSDLKSKEQQQALMDIVKQKNLSPPPQLTSRSIDQSSTRLALKTNPSNQSNNNNTINNNPFIKSKDSLDASSATSSPDSMMVDVGGKSYAGRKMNMIVNGDAIRDEDHYIEFLSNDHHHRSQFEASQFSASDFNNSTTNSESNSGQGTDSLASPIIANSNQHMFDESVTNYQIVTQKLHNDVQSKESQQKPEVDDIDQVDGAQDAHSPRSFDLRDDNLSVNSFQSGKYKSNKILGNVIDVEVCSLNAGHTQSSPLKNQA